jgi:hypothetical protein
VGSSQLLGVVGSNKWVYRHVFTDVDIQHIFRIAKNAKSFSRRLLIHINQTYISANGLGVRLYQFWLEHTLIFLLAHYRAHLWVLLRYRSAFV